MCARNRTIKADTEGENALEGVFLFQQESVLFQRILSPQFVSQLIHTSGNKKTFKSIRFKPRSSLQSFWHQQYAVSDFRTRERKQHYISITPAMHTNMGHSMSRSQNGLSNGLNHFPCLRHDSIHSHFPLWYCE